MAFDVDAARAAGYSDDEIAAHLAAKTPNFNVPQARAAGYSPAEIIQHLTGPQATQQPAAKIGSENAPDDPGFWGTVMVKGGSAVNKLIAGLAQAYLGATGATDSTKAALKSQVDEDARLQAPLTAAHPVASAIGETLPSMAVPVGGAASVLGRMGKAAFQGAVVPALQYADSATDRLKNAATSAIGSGVGAGVLPLVGRAIGQGATALSDSVRGTVTPQLLALYNRAQALGIPVSRAQLSDSSFMKTLASQIEKMPFTGGAAARTDQQAAFNQAVSKTIGEDTPVVDQTTYANAKDRIGSEFQRLSSQNNLRVTPALISDVNGVLDRARRFGTPQDSQTLENLVSDLQSRQVGGQIPGQAYQSSDSTMSSLMKPGNTTSMFIGELRDAVRNGMDHSISPADQGAWMDARGQYRNLKAIRNLITPEGDISPSMLAGQLKTTGAGKESMAMGNRGDLGDIADVGRMIRDKVPNSGTTQRNLAAAILTGGGVGIAGIPATAAAAAGSVAIGRVANSFLNTGASGARAAAAATARGTAAAPATLSQLLTQNPTKGAADAGAAVGRTLADLNRNQ